MNLFENGIEIISARCPHCDRARIYLANRWDQIRCTHCGSLFMTPQMIPAEAQQMHRTRKYLAG